MEKEGCKYFFNSAIALREALKSKRIPTSNPNVDALQVCYYDGVPLIDAPKNCINVPISNFYEYFLMTKHILPKHIVFEGMEFSEDVTNQLITAISDTLKSISKEQDDIANTLLEDRKKYKPDFSNGHRIFLIASRETTVMQHISRNIYQACKELGYETFLSIEDNDMQRQHHFIHLANFMAFKPTITININHLNNMNLPDEIFNFVWFQDSMQIVTNDKALNLRERDFLFALIPGIQKALIQKGATDCEIQDFCIDRSIYKQYPDIKRKEKIVFIGGSYKENYFPYTSSCGGVVKDVIHDANTDLLLEELIDIYRQDGKFTSEMQNRLSQKYNKSDEFIHNYAIPYVVRDITILELCKMNLDYEIEIYGWGWEKYDELKPYYKGVLAYGEEISKVYNSAKYAIIAHPYYLIQQRTLESAASGCIPIVYDCRFNEDVYPPYHENSMLFFQNLNNLEILLKEGSIDKNLEELVDDYSYTAFIKKIISKV